jgi:DNA-binding MarR family transcriptional regulator
MTKDTMVGLNVHDVARMIRRDFDRRAREQGLTRARWQVLWHLARLEQEGLVERRGDPSDRRRRRLYLTEAATPALERLRQLAALTRERAFDGLTSEQIDTFREVLEAMRANLCDRPDQGDAQ